MTKQIVCGIIDRSGSMKGKEEDTIGGINSAIELLKDELDNDVDIKITMKFFDHESYLLFKDIDINEVRPLKRSDLKPRGQTALLDAIGSTLKYYIQKKVNDPKCFDSCVIYVSTDGLENCSKIYNNNTIKDNIEIAKELGIVLLYLGANQDAILEARKFGLNEGLALNYTEDRASMESAYRSAGNAAKRHRTGTSIDFLPTERMESQLN
tara:strand:- start:419 stop:1048 length:630 start_codon:yes stop_codon:yes gene_type:complete